MIDENIIGMEERGSSRSVWCHNCINQTLADLDAQTHEYNCNSCGGSFVEHLGQGLEQFISQDRNNSTDPVTPPPTEPMRESTQTRGSSARGELGAVLIQRIVNRILGLGVQTRPSVQSTLLTVLQQAAVESGRPVGIVVRQSTTPRELALLTSLLGMGRSGEGGEGSPDLASLFATALGGTNNNLGMALEGRGLEDFLHHIMMHESTQSGAPPASDEAIQCLQRQTISANNSNHLGVCCISQESFEVGDVAITLPCGHSYKEIPIVQWLKRHNSCPVCRVVISSNEGESPSVSSPS